MRDTRRMMVKRSRRNRRAVIAVMVLAGSPLLAGEPRQSAFNRMPPLPINPIQASTQIQPNPYCQDVPVDPSTPVQLASGHSTSIRLKPIGAAVGLQSIDNPVKVNGPVVTIEAPKPSRVRNNPLVQSEHRENPELVTQEIDDRASGTDGGPVVTAQRLPTQVKIHTPVAPIQTSKRSSGGSSIVLVPAATVNVLAPQPAPKNPPVITEAFADPPSVMNLSDQTTQQEFSGVPEPVVIEETIQTEPATMSLSDRSGVSINRPAGSVLMVAPPQTQIAERAPQPPEKKATIAASGAVNFSLTDDAQPTTPPLPVDITGLDASDQAVSAPSRNPQSKIVVNTFAVGSDEDSQSFPDVLTGDSPMSEPAEFGASPDTIALSDVTPIVLDDHPSGASLTPIDSVIEAQAASPPIAIYRVEPVVRAPVKTAEATLHNKRYRPPVAVTSVPVAFDRSATTPVVVDEPTVQPVAEIDLASTDQINGKIVKLTPLHMSRTQVRSLTLGGKVRSVQVADKSVCQAFSAGPNQLKLIGTGNGVTQLVVWAEADGGTGTAKMRAFEVHVKDVVESPGDSVGHKAGILNESIRKAFPRCDVSVRPSRDQIVVVGRCDSEASAKKIIRMVRKTCLVPVQDQLVVR